jgi:hypothetical protein
MCPRKAKAPSLIRQEAGWLLSIVCRGDVVFGHDLIVMERGWWWWWWWWRDVAGPASWCPGCRFLERRIAQIVEHKETL